MINTISVQVTPINILKNACNIVIKEQYNITNPESTGTAPIINYSYQINAGYNLYKTGDNIVTDDYNKFSDLSIDNYLVIYSPSAVAGYYKIISISDDRKSLTIDPLGSLISLPLPSFNNGVYQILINVIK